MKSLLKFIYHENEINNIDIPPSHLVINSNSITSNLIKSLYLYKLQNRNVKTLFHCSIFFSENMGPKGFIKFLTDNGFDGCIFESNNPYNYFHVNKIINTCFQLPAPYNFNWEFYIDFSILNIKESILFTVDKIQSIPFSSNIRGFIMEFSILEKFDLSNDESNNLVDGSQNFDKFQNFGNIIITTKLQSQKELLSFYNKHNFRGILINKFINDFKIKSINYEGINNVEYPTSNILKQLSSLHNSSSLN